MTQRVQPVRTGRKRRTVRRNRPMPNSRRSRWTSLETAWALRNLVRTTNADTAGYLAAAALRMNVPQEVVVCGMVSRALVGRRPAWAADSEAVPW